MKSYLELANISARVHRRRSRMTRLCIFLAVFLVAAIFGMADMEISNQRTQTIAQYGSWHAAIKGGLSESGSALLAARPEVARAAWYGAFNTKLGSDFTVNGQRVAICGAEEGWLDMFPSVTYTAGGYPSEPGMVALTQNAERLLGASLGSTVELRFPDGHTELLRTAGFISDTPMMDEQDSAGLLLNCADYRRYFGGTPETELWFYMEFTPFCNMQRALADIQAQFSLSEEQIGRHPKLFALSGQSSDPFIRMLYSSAAILSALVAASGIMMIRGSLDSSISQRTAFFGLLRCLGATPKQVRKFVRREALGWCCTAVPLGLLAGSAVVWGLCAVLRVLVPSYFDSMPRFGVSPAALVSGAAVGVLTVLLAARAPAKKAAKVSPLAAVSGNAGTVFPVKRAANTRLFRIETALGVHHAVGSRRSFLLMAGSFAFSIVLFLAFSTTVDFMHHAVHAVRPSEPDFNIIGDDDQCVIDRSVAEGIAALPAVKRVYGASVVEEIQAESDGEPVIFTLISMEENRYRWAKAARIDGDFSEAEKGEGFLLLFQPNAEQPGGSKLLKTGDFVTVNGYALPVAATASQFEILPGNQVLLCSEELFSRLTGVEQYSYVSVQFRRGVTDADVEQIRALAGEKVHFSDSRLSNREARGAYYSFALFVYGFLAVIAMIAAFHIINSISLGVSARMQQYGAMRAAGMGVGQLVRMVAAEAVCYALGGVALGSAVGIPLHWLLFRQMVSFQWGDPWQVPWKALLLIAAVTLAAVAAAVLIPAKRLRELAVTETISAD